MYEIVIVQYFTKSSTQALFLKLVVRNIQLLHCNILCYNNCRKDKLKVKSVYQYDDGADDGTDEFSREPFGVLVESSTTGGNKFLDTVGSL